MDLKYNKEERGYEEKDPVTEEEYEKSIKLLNQRCETKWKELYKLHELIKEYEEFEKKETQEGQETTNEREKIDNDNIEEASLQMMIYERDLLKQEIESLKEDLPKTIFEKDPIINQIYMQNYIQSEISQKKQAIVELQYQIKKGEEEINHNDVRLQEIKEVLEAIKKKNETKEAGSSGHLKEMNRKKVQANNLFLGLNKFIDKYYPVKQPKINKLITSNKKEVPPNSLKKILEELMNNAVNDPNVYYRIPEPLHTKTYKQEYEPFITLLNSSKLIQFDPQDPTKIRLIKF
ncbi:hypothetical protein K502DRAFT_362416 [Neoconidiobolus thromboides FSU 785]|nr:hypothetical protein K502DRAFT_362416 [Neoconidiobolus thromboides FSU 785]